MVVGFLETEKLESFVLAHGRIFKFTLELVECPVILFSPPHSQ